MNFRTNKACRTYTTTSNSMILKHNICLDFVLLSFSMSPKYTTQSMNEWSWKKGWFVPQSIENAANCYTQPYALCSQQLLQHAACCNRNVNKICQTKDSCVKGMYLQQINTFPDIIQHYMCTWRKHCFAWALRQPKQTRWLRASNLREFITACFKRAGITLPTQPQKSIKHVFSHPKLASRQSGLNSSWSWLKALECQVLLDLL